MLIPKLINAFLFIIFLIFSFSLIFFILDKLPKAQITITYSLNYFPSNSLNLCSIFSNVLKNEIISFANCDESQRQKIENEIIKYFRFYEIEIGNKKIKSSDFKPAEIYECLIYDERVYKAIIKI